MYLANPHGANNKVAIKSINKRKLSENPLLPQMMLSELLVLKTCDHPNIMGVKEILEDKANFYIVSEFVEGGELFDRIVKVSKFTEKEAARIIQ